MNKKDSFVSLVIPVYNASNSIENLIKDILNQTCENFEVIFVDDGSTDSSYEIIDEYIKRYDNFYAYRKKNEGVSKARNFALNVMSPEGYVMFADSDDNIMPNFIERMVHEAEQHKKSLVCCTYINGKYDYNEQTDKFTAVLDEKMAGGFVWNKIFDKKIILNNNLRFNPSISICEDLLFCIEYLNFVHDVYIFHEDLYVYNLNLNSATNSQFNDDKLRSQLVALNEVVEFIPQEFNEAKSLAYSGVLYNMIFYWVRKYNAGFFEKPTKKERIKIMSLKKKSFMFSKKEFFYMLLIIFWPKLLWKLICIKNTVKSKL